MNLEHFHFLRPGWLLILPFGALILWKLRQQMFNQSDWGKACDPALLQVLLVGSDAARQWLPLAGIGLVWFIAGLALAGPAWDQQPQPTYRSGHDRVIVFDLSRSMDATDIQPSRLSQSRFKLLDLVAGAKDRQQALIVFAADAFLVSPLTDDHKTLSNLIPALNTDTIPVQGSRSDKGLEMALKLLENAGSRGAEVILVADGIHQQSAKIAEQLAGRGHRLNVLGVGTPEGAPIPLPGGGLLKNKNGNIIIAGVDMAAMKNLARAGKGDFLLMRTDNQDIERLNQAPVDGLEQFTSLRNTTGIEGSIWIDRGVWLLLPLLLLGSLAFRKGWLLIGLLFLITEEQTAYAFGWQDLWLRPDQQASQALAAQQPMSVPPSAGALWRGAGAYKAGDHTAAAEHFAEQSSAAGYYNLGNALAQSEKFKQAIEAYDNALAIDPAFEDASFNRDLVSQLLQQQSQQSQQSDQSQQSSDDEQKQSSEQSESSSAEDSSQQNQDESNQGQQQNQTEQSAQSGSEQDNPTESEANSSETLSQQQPGQNQKLSEQDEPMPTAQSSDTTAAEQQQALDQWLKQVPDDPGGLLKRKFRYQYSQRAEQTREVEQW